MKYMSALTSCVFMLSLFFVFEINSTTSLGGKGQNRASSEEQYRSC